MPYRKFTQLILCDFNHFQYDYLFKIYNGEDTPSNDQQTTSPSKQHFNFPEAQLVSAYREGLLEGNTESLHTSTATIIINL